MPSRTRGFMPRVQAEMLDFMEYHRKYTEKCIDEASDPKKLKQYAKLQKYLHNIILRRANLDADVYSFGSRIIGTSSSTSDLDLFVDVGEVIFNFYES